MTVVSTMLSNAGEFEDLWRWQRKEDEGTAESDRTCDAWNCWSCKDWKCRRFIRCNQAALYFAYTKEGSPRSFKERCSWWGRNSDTESWEGAESQIKPGFRCTFDTFACLISYYNIISKLYQNYICISWTFEVCPVHRTQEELQKAAAEVPVLKKSLAEVEGAISGASGAGWSGMTL